MTRSKLMTLTLFALLALLLPAIAGAATPHQSGGTTGIGTGVTGPGQQPGAGLLQTIRATAPLVTYTFDTNDGAWSLGSNAQSARSIARGQLLMQLDATDTFIWSLNERPLGDFYLEVDTAHLAGAIDNFFGVIFRMQDPNNFYLAVVSSDGQFTLGKYVDDSFTTLARWTPTDALNAGRGGSNRLGLLALGNQITLLANDQELSTIQDSSFTQGAWGLTLGSIDSGATAVAFDNATVWLPNTTPTAPQRPGIGGSGDRQAPGNTSSGDATVAPAVLNVRSGPSTNYPVISTLKQGASVRIIGRSADNTWVKIELFGHDEAWVATTFLDLRVDLRNVPFALAPPPPPPAAAPTPKPKPAARSNVAYLVIENHVGRYLTVQVNDRNFVVAGKTGDVPGRYTFELQGTGHYRVAAQLPNEGSHNFDLYVEENPNQCANRTGCVALGQTYLQTYY